VPLPLPPRAPLVPPNREEIMSQPQVKRDPLGIVYDSSYEDSDGVVHYTRNRAQGTAQGPAQWSSEHDCNPICGCHLASKCRSCNVCMTCDGCYCNESRE
jgi:hypothetical protein